MPTPEQLKAGLAVMLAVAESIREVGEAPSGTIYAAMMDRMNLQCYESMLSALTGAGLITVQHHVIRWVGPAALTPPSSEQRGRVR